MTHNYRYSPRNSALKELIKNGSIGTPLSVTFEWVLDTAHGADYFRRWHRDKDNSGGLLIHKASHHFDLVNWWLADAPSPGVRPRRACEFYGAENAAARGLPSPAGSRHPRGQRSPLELDLHRRSQPQGALPRQRVATTATCATRTCSARASPSRTTWR